MAVQWSAPELATRYSTHVEELRDFFALQQLHFGAAQDIALLMARIDSSESFREDMTSMVRSIILHEGGTIPRANLLEIVAIAIGGRDMDQAGLEVQEPLHQLLAFLSSVLRKPWNQPPGESRLQVGPLPTVSRGVTEVGDEMPPAGSVTSPVSPPPNSEAAPVAVAKVIPITARPAHPYAQHGVYSRLPRSGAGAAAPDPVVEAESELRPRPAPEPIVLTAALAVPPEPDLGPDPELDLEPIPEESVDAGAPTPVPEPIPPPPPPPLVETAPAAAFVGPPPGELPQPSAAMLRPPSALDPEPPSPSSHASMHLPFALPSISFLEFRLPKIALPALSGVRTRIALLSAGGAVLLIAVLFAASRSHSPAAVQTSPAQVAPAQVAQQAPALASPTDSGAAAIAPAGAPAKPSADGPAIGRPLSRSSRQNARDDDYIAKPYSTPIPGQTGAAPIVRVDPVQSAAETPASQTRTSAAHLTALPVSTQSGARGLVHPSDPDATYVRAAPGASAEEAIPLPRRPASVASSVMAANLVSAPAPGYPVLAKVAHVQGPVVLRAEVDRDGMVTDVRVLSGHRLLRGAAVDAVKRRRYRPYLVDGHPAAVSTTITLNFPETVGRRNK